ncbi:MAG: hypothetical protein M3R05_00525 [Chloroflexota bacterium]|nr:hypothetical protein [Chloroflexota bacterium]
MFRRRQRNQANAEAAREAERKALFVRLAERPETVCPFLGLANDRTGYVDGATDEHRCYAFGDPAPLSDEQQTRVCLQRGYGNCPRYLRGVLVIPTEELEALRRPHAPAPPSREPAQKSRRRRGVLVPVLLLLILLGGGGAATWAVLNGILPGVASASPTPAATTGPTPVPTATPSDSVEPTETPEPTPTLGDVFQFYEVGVSKGEYRLYDVDDAGQVIGTRAATFSRDSHATVEEVVAANGQRHWRYLGGVYVGLSYVYPDSGPFVVRKVFRRPDGTRSSTELPVGSI